jgi:O-antigen/teichoic acid export membrane protein
VLSVSELHPSDITGLALQAAAGTAAFTILTSMDVIFARRIFPAELAGLYSAAATLGKIVLVLPEPVAVLMLPKSSARHASGASRFPILLKSVLATLILSLTVTVAMALWPGGILNLLYGPAFTPAAGWLALYGIASTGSALTFVLMMHYLAAHDGRFVLILIVFALGQSLALNYLPLGPLGYILTLALSAWGIILVAVLGLEGLRKFRPLRSEHG